MLHINNLPALVIIEILKNVTSDIENDMEEFKQKLIFVAVCRYWRHTGLRLVCNQIFAQLEAGYELSTNIDLFKSGKYNNFVTKLKLRIRPDDIANGLGTLLSALNMDEIEWPSNYNMDKANEDVTTHYNAQTLGDDLYKTMANVIGNFAQNFSNIIHLALWIPCPSGIASQLASKLINVYSNTLRILHCDVNAPLNIESFPSGLAKLTYICHVHSLPLIPKINPSTLTCLQLENVFNDFSWQECFESSIVPTYGGPIVFPRLKSLSIYSCDEVAREMRRKITREKGFATSRQKRNKTLRLPSMKCLYIYSSTYDKWKFSPKFISSSLDEVEYWAHANEITSFTKLPIKHVKKLNMWITYDDSSTRVRHAVEKYVKKVASSETASIEYIKN